MRLQGFRLCLAAAMFALVMVPVLSAQAVQVTRADGTVTTLTAAQIAALPHVSVSVKDHETPAQFDGVSLAAVLKLAGVVSEDKMKGPQLTQALLIEAADGYKVVFALAEIDPDFATREILLADKRDGKPLDDKHGPFQIVAPGDKRPARWIRQVTAFKVVSVK
jgi:hypothetical protein